MTHNLMPNGHQDVIGLLSGTFTCSVVKGLNRDRNADAYIFDPRVTVVRCQYFGMAALQSVCDPFESSALSQVRT